MFEACSRSGDYFYTRVGDSLYNFIIVLHSRERVMQCGNEICSFKEMHKFPVMSRSKNFATFGGIQVQGKKSRFVLFLILQPLS
jgi:hypothetical protein